MIDIDALQHKAAYSFEHKFARKFTTIFDNFDNLRKLARAQYEQQGAQFIQQVAEYDGVTNTLRYTYKPSFNHVPLIGGK